MNSIVDSVASDRKSLTVALVNPTQEPQSLNLHLEGVQLAGGAQMWQMTAPRPDAANVLAARSRYYRKSTVAGSRNSVHRSCECYGLSISGSKRSSCCLTLKAAVLSTTLPCLNMQRGQREDENLSCGYACTDVPVDLRHVEGGGTKRRRFQCFSAATDRPM